MQEEDYGLSTADIFTLSDKDLNQLVGLRKYAPYKEGIISNKAKRDTQHRLGKLRQVWLSNANQCIPCTRSLAVQSCNLAMPSALPAFLK